MDSGLPHVSYLVELAARAEQLAADLLRAAEALRLEPVAQAPPQPVTVVRQLPDDRVWFTTGQAATHVGMHVQTVLKALNEGLLHGSQRTVPNGRWRIRIDCLDTWAAGGQCPHSVS